MSEGRTVVSEARLYIAVTSKTSTLWDIGHAPPKALFSLVYVRVLIPFFRASQAAGSFARLPLLYPSQNTAKCSLLALLPTFKPWNRNCFPKWPGRVMGTRALPCLSPQVHPLSCFASSVLVCLMTVEYVTEWTMSWFICSTLFNCVNVKKSPQGKPRGTTQPMQSLAGSPGSSVLGGGMDEPSWDVC